MLPPHHLSYSCLFLFCLLVIYYMVNKDEYIIRQQSNRIHWEKRKIKAITPFKVIQGHRGRYQSKARMRLPISD